MSVLFIMKLFYYLNSEAVIYFIDGTVFYSFKKLHSYLFY